ncbi:transcription factor vestigial isoform X2 [Lycorma delicatula]|uniref:transcription factor vestigial isoform X2 n=1 Tax=Lycorma delicatula TaxID=130591 RepID=UPI003F515583
MSCSEVVYQAYYPYLYQRPSTSSTAQSRASHFPAFSHNYDRFNVSAYGGGTTAQSSGSVSSGGGAGSPGSPLAHKDEEATPPEQPGDDEAASPGGSRAQYVSANCVVFTHYTGDVAAVVDEHFTRALSYKTASPNSAKESSPMSARNFPPSFWNSNYQGSSGSVPSHHGDLYGEPVYHNVPSASTDPWHHPHYQYTHHRAVHEYHHHHHHNMAAQYGSLLLPPPGRLPHQYHHAKPPPDWNRPQQHALDPGSSYASYPTMPGLEAQVQAESKDLYWF